MDKRADSRAGAGEKTKISLEHLVVPESEEAPQKAQEHDAKAQGPT